MFTTTDNGGNREFLDDSVITRGYHTAIIIIARWLPRLHISYIEKPGVGRDEIRAELYNHQGRQTKSLQLHVSE